MASQGYFSARVVRPEGIGPATVLVDGERIAEVVSGPKALPGALDFGSWVIGPGPGRLSRARERGRGARNGRASRAPRALPPRAA